MSRPLTGHIRQRKNGLWEGQYVYERERRSIYGQTQEKVSQQLDEIIVSIKNGNYIRPNQHTLISWLREWLHTYAKPTLRPATFTNYEVNIERHFNTELGKVRLKNVSTRMLQNFFNEKLVSGRADKKPGGLSPKTLKNMRYMLHVALDQAYYDQLIPFNPVNGVRLPVPDSPEQRVLRPEGKRAGLYLCGNNSNTCRPRRYPPFDLRAAERGIVGTAMAGCGLGERNHKNQAHTVPPRKI